MTSLLFVLALALALATHVSVLVLQFALYILKFFFDNATDKT